MPPLTWGVLDPTLAKLVFLSEGDVGSTTHVSEIPGYARLVPGLILGGPEPTLARADGSLTWVVDPTSRFARGSTRRPSGSPSESRRGSTTHVSSLTWGCGPPRHKMTRFVESEIDPARDSEAILDQQHDCLYVLFLFTIL